MSNPVLISKRSFDIDGGNIAVEFDPGGSGSTTDNIGFTGSKTLEEIKADIDSIGTSYYSCNLIEDRIRIEATGGVEILSVTITNSNLQNIMGGAYVLSETGFQNYAYSETWGLARIPFIFALTTTDLLQGGVRDKKPFLKKLSGKDYIGSTSVSSNKVIFRRGYTLNLRLDFNQIEWIQDFLEFSRNENLHVINGVDYNFIEADEWSLLTENTDSYSGIYNYLDVGEMNVGILKI